MLGTGVEPECDLGDQGQGAFGPDDQLGQVVPTGGLHELAPGPYHLAGAQHRLDAQHVVAGHAVLDRPHATGVGGHVAPQTGRLLTGEHRIDEPEGGEGVVEFGQGQARLHHGHVVVGVDLEEGAHPLEGHHDASGDRDAPTREPGPRPPGGEGDALLPGGLDDGGHLGGGARTHHGAWSDGHRAQGLVVTGVVADPVAEVEMGRADDGG